MESPAPLPQHDAALAKIGDLAAGAGIERIHLLAWRDLDDPEAGGSEVHAATVARLWAEAGLDVQLRTSFAAGQRPVARRDGYRVVRKAGRYLVFPRAALSEITGRSGPRDALVEIWNGMPFLSPLWSRGPRAVWLHHVHKQMWQMALPPRLARLGNSIEERIAPPLYRWSPVVTLSESSRRELIDELGFRPDRVHVVPPGVDPRFRPGGTRSPRPLVVAVGRLVPVKRFPVLVRAMAEIGSVAGAQPELVIVGQGYERDAIRSLVRDLDAEGWVRLVGHVEDDDLVALYRQAWVVASASEREGWGMTLTEAAACATPAVATRIPGHVDAVLDGRTGILVDDGVAPLRDALARVLGDDALRRRLGLAAAERAAQLTWEATSTGCMAVLAEEAHRLAGRPWAPLVRRRTR